MRLLLLDIVLAFAVAMSMHLDKCATSPMIMNSSAGASKIVALAGCDCRADLSGSGLGILDFVALDKGCE